MNHTIIFTTIVEAGLCGFLLTLVVGVFYEVATILAGSPLVSPASVASSRLWRLSPFG